jgi:H+-translocating NAD(P) transhydrogenase subunit alpha
MKIFVPKIEAKLDPRVVVTPETAAKLVQLGVEVEIESGLGIQLGYADAAYSQSGARVVSSKVDGLSSADWVFCLQRPDGETLKAMPRGSRLLGSLEPFGDKALLRDFVDAGIEALSMELIPRSTLAQKMDVLSSQANLAGYAAVILAAGELDKILPMMMTPAGTLQPSRVFILGVGVAGLQAIATAKRLGAQVEAFDTRPVVEEQVRSLGGRFLKIDLGGETGQTEQGYAKELTPEQLERQREGLAKACARADIVITTAKLFGRPAPRLLSASAIEKMAAGSVIVDLAVETGGNVEGSKLDETVVTANGVRIMGPRKAENTYPLHASQMLAANYFNFFSHFWDAKEKQFIASEEDPIMSAIRLTRDGKWLHPQISLD